MVGGGFQHQVCSTDLNRTKKVIWVKDYSSNLSIHIDHGIFNRPDPNKENFGWISESSEVVSDVLELIKTHSSKLKEIYKYIFTHDTRLISEDPSFFKYAIPPLLPWIQNRKIYSKSKNCSFITSNKNSTSGQKLRLEVLNKFINNVDYFGRESSNNLPPRINYEGIEESGKLLALKDYSFSFAFENSNYDDYITEKVTDCFATGTIPIYWGTKNINKYFDPDGIIMYDENFNFEMLTLEYYVSKLKNIENNLEIVHNLQSSEDYIYENYLK